MNAERVRHLFRDQPQIFNENWDFIDWYFVDAAPNTARRLWTLTFKMDDRSFYATLERSMDDAGEFGFQTHVPAKLVALLRSLLPPEDIARCTRASLKL